MTGVFIREETPGAQRKDHVKTQRKGGHLQAEERDLRRKPPNSGLTMDFQLPELRENKLLWFMLPSLWYFVMGALANLYRHQTLNPGWSENINYD